MYIESINILKLFFVIYLRYIDEYLSAGILNDDL